MQDMKFTMDIVYRDIVNKNGWRIPLCKFKEAVNSPKIKELIDNEKLYIYDNNEIKMKPFKDFSSSKIIGKVLSINLDNFTAEVELKHGYSPEGFSLFFGYTGDNSQKVISKDNQEYTLFKDIKLEYVAFDLSSASCYYYDI